MALEVLTRRRASPVKVLSTIWMFVPLFCILVFLFNRSTPYPSQALGPEDKNTVHNVTWTNALPAAKTAYVYTFFSGRFDDTQRFIATLTSIEALRRTNTNRDIVVMINNRIQQGQIEILKSHGAIVHTIPEQDLFSSKSSQILPLGSYCYSNFAPIYTWSLEQYDRVIWLDADVLPQMNMDEFFLCGEFCLTYSNLQWYTTSIMVIKPSKDKLIDLFNKLNTMGGIPGKLRQQEENFFQNINQCQTLFEEFLIQSFYYIESAPLFNPEGNGQQHVPMMRLNMGAVINPIYWYEKYSWDLARGGGYINMTSNSEFNVPGHSIGYPRVKPYDWLQAIYWNTSWVWTHWRSVLLQESFFSLSLSILSIGFLTVFLSLLGINILFKLLKTSSSSSLSPSPRSNDINNNELLKINQNVKKHRLNSILFFPILSFLYKISSFIGVFILSIVIGTICIIITGYIAYTMIPYHTIYYVAWPLFAILLGLFQYSALCWVCNIFFYSVNGADVMGQCDDIISSQDALMNGSGGSRRNRNSSSLNQEGIELDSLGVNERGMRGNNGIDGGNDENFNNIGQNGDKNGDKTCPFTRAEWESICTTTKQFKSNPNGVLLTLIDPNNGLISPLTQRQLILQICHFGQIPFNILLILIVYLINQFQIYPHFAVKIMAICTGILAILVSFLKPYTSLVLLFNYSGTIDQNNQNNRLTK